MAALEVLFPQRNLAVGPLFVVVVGQGNKKASVVFNVPRRRSKCSGLLERVNLCVQIARRGNRSETATTCPVENIALFFEILSHL